MNRELKFRAWDDYKMIHFSLSDLHGSDIGELRADQYCECEDLTSIVSSKTIMQFTGLHDKNGKEIYEGDIYQYLVATVYHEDTDEYEWGVAVGVVEYSTVAGHPAIGYVLRAFESDREVIGNIYENPALLDQ